MILPLCVITFPRVTVVSRSKGRATNTVTREKEKNLGAFSYERNAMTSIKWKILQVINSASRLPVYYVFKSP